MKNHISIFLLSIILLGAASCKKNDSVSVNPLGPVKSDSISMTAGYANEVYYSVTNGVIQTSSRATWDIAFRTSKRSSSILINDGSGVVLYTYPKADTTGWVSMDTIGLSLWKPMYNDPADWENGAFSRNAKEYPDYGWAIYNAVTHDLIGDSLFVIKLRDGSYKKLWIIKKLSSLDIYLFRFANLDGTNELTVTQDLSTLTGSDFYGYSLETATAVAIEPSKQSWDILFTKFMSIQPDGTPYLVTGVLVNDVSPTKKFYPVSLNYTDYNPGTWDSTRSSIGWNWKHFDMGTSTYKVVDSIVYFVTLSQGDVYKLYFTVFAGSSTGVVKFKLQKVAGAGISAVTEQSPQWTAFPNLTGSTGNELTFILTDLSGRQLRADRLEQLTIGLSAFSMDETGVQPGMYFGTVCIAATNKVSEIIFTQKA